VFLSFILLYNIGLIGRSYNVLFKLNCNKM